MRIVRKLVLWAAAQAVLLTALGLYVADDSWQRVKSSQALVEKVHHVEQFSRLLHEVQRERGYTALYLTRPSEASEGRLREQRLMTDFVLGTLAGYLRNYVAAVDLGRLDGQRSRVDQRGVGAEAAIGEYTEIANALLAYLAQLTRPDGTTGELTRALIAHVTLARVKEYAGLERALVGQAFADSAVPRPELARRWADIAARQSELLEQSFLVMASPEVSALYRAAVTSETVAEVEGLRQAARIRFAGGEAIDPQLWFEKASTRIDALARVEAESSRLLQEAGARLAQAQTQRMSVVTAVLLLGLGLAMHQGRRLLRGVSGRPLFGRGRSRGSKSVQR